MPSVPDFPTLFSTIRHPRRSRSISIGPQSEADAYEALAFRHRIRRESTPTGRTSISWESSAKRDGSMKGISEHTRASSQSTVASAAVLSTQQNLSVDTSRSQKWSDTAVFTPPTPSNIIGNANGVLRTPSQMRRQDEKEEKEIFSKLAKRRVRYDVEVITKMIVYSGQFDVELF